MRTAFILGAGAVVLLPLACASSSDVRCPNTPAPAAAPVAPIAAAVPPPVAPKDDNPLLAKWKGPHGGVPPFAKVKVEQFKPALETAMDENRKELNALGNDASPATFENTIAAMEDSGRTLSDVEAVYAIWAATMNDASFQAVEREMAPKLAAFSDEITQN